MFCPQCGERRASAETNYCSGCGYLLTGTAELLAAGGLVRTHGNRLSSPKSRGVKQGLFIFMLGFLADLMATNRRLLERIEWRVRKLELSASIARAKDPVPPA